MHLNSIMKPGVIVIVMAFLLQAMPVAATTWSPALPYIQKTEGQSVVIKAKAYQPYDSKPYGLTEVYKEDTLLYTIDRYFREDVFTSYDGIYFVVVMTNNYAGVTSVTYFGQNWINYDEEAIVVYKNGVLHKVFTIRDIVDTAKLPNDGVFYDWGYTINWDRERVREMLYNCESCIETYGKEVLASCDTNEIFEDECVECNNDCDSLALFKKEIAFSRKTKFVKDNVLYVISKEEVVLINFSDLQIQKVPFERVVKNKDKFNPPLITTTYDSLLILPDKFAFPHLYDGRNVDSALKHYLNENYPELLARNDRLYITIRKFVLNKSGLCEELELYPHLCATKTECQKLKKIIEPWLMLQNYDTSLIPGGFDKYSFYDFIHMK